MLFKKDFIEKMATFFGLGNSPIMPGTVGTLGGIPLVLGLKLVNDNIYFYILVFFIFFAIFISSKAEEIYGKKDSQNIVIDEVVGYLVTMFLLPITIKTILIGFLLFRFFDITKIYPISKLQEMEGGIGVVIDDILAGIFANIVLWGIVLFVL
ncbi:MAG: phosphatidylglycerophosphatase A family protein [Fusobacteriota bacterium]